MFATETNATFALEAHLNLITTIIVNRYFEQLSMMPCSFEINGDSETSLTISDFPRMILPEDNFHFPDIERCQNILINTQQPFVTFNTFEDFIKKHTQVRYNYRRYLLIVSKHDLSACAGGFDDSFSEIGRVHDKNGEGLDCEHLTNLKYVHDFLLMHCDGYLNSEESRCTFYTFLINEHGATQWLFLDDWYWHNQSFVHGKNLYPDRLDRFENQFGDDEVKDMHAGGTDYLPYSHIESKMGMELTAIIEYAERYNFTIHLHNDEEYWGEIYENWTGPGVLGGVVSDKYDIGFSALFMLPDRILYSDFTRPTAFSRVSCIVPAPKLVESWLTPIRGLTTYIWSGVFVTFLVLTFVFKAIGHYMLQIDVSLKHIRPLSMYAIFVMQPLVITQLPKRFPLRLLYTVTFLFALLMTTVYNSRLSSLLVVPMYEQQINTVADLARSGLLWGEMAIDWALPLKADQRPIYKVVYKKFRVVDEEALRDFSLNNNFAFGIERLITGHYAVGAYIHEDVVNQYRVMHNDLYKQYTCLQLRKNSVLLPSIDIFLLQAWEYGLLYYWENQANMKHTNYKVQKSLMNPPLKDDNLVILQMFHIKGLFLFWVIGLTISLTTFFMEIRYFKYNSILQKERLKSDQKKKRYKDVELPLRKIMIMEKERNVITITELSPTGYPPKPQKQKSMKYI